MKKNQIQNSHSPGNAFAYRPSTSSQYEYQIQNYYENADLNSSEERNQPSSATYYSSKMRAKFNPKSTKNTIVNSAFLPQNLNYLTKEKILKLTDSEINEYIGRIHQSGRPIDSSGYLFLAHADMSSPMNYARFNKISKKPKYQNNATKLASDLFSYYKQPSK